MSDIQRYDIVALNQQHRPSSIGYWVKHSDHLKEIEKWNKKYHKLEVDCQMTNGAKIRTINKLKEYAQHKIDCEFLIDATITGCGTTCTCGLDKLLKENK